jgi:hypothetical protein
MRITLNLLGAAAATLVLMFVSIAAGFNPPWLGWPTIALVLLAIVAAPFELALMLMGEYPRR